MIRLIVIEVINTSSYIYKITLQRFYFKDAKPGIFGIRKDQTWKTKTRNSCLISLYHILLVRQRMSLELKKLSFDKVYFF